MAASTWMSGTSLVFTMRAERCFFGSRLIQALRSRARIAFTIPATLSRPSARLIVSEVGPTPVRSMCSRITSKTCV